MVGAQVLKELNANSEPLIETKKANRFENKKPLELGLGFRPISFRRIVSVFQICLGASALQFPDVR